MADPALNSNEIRAMLLLLQTRIEMALGANQLGFYVVGSLVTGDFDFRSSDIDLIVTLAQDPTEAEVQALAAMHAEVARRERFWEDRIEIIYITQERLKGDRADYTFPITSPGEPFHIRDIHHDDWIVNWYVLRESSITLLGADPKTLVPPISPERLAEVVRTQAKMTPDWLEPTASLGAQAYAILTLCRGFCLVRTGDFVSKPQAAALTAAQFPQWASLIERALVWRAAGKEPLPGSLEQFPETRGFVDFMVEQIG